MAQEDLDTMVVVKTDAANTADDNITEWTESAQQPNEIENRQAAADAGVSNAAYIRYDVALDKYADRSDVEDLAHKNARDMPADFAEAGFMRSADADARDHGSSTPPG